MNGCILASQAFQTLLWTNICEALCWLPVTLARSVNDFTAGVTHFHFPAAFCCGCNLKSIDYNVAMTFILNNNNNNNKFTVGHETVCWVTMVKVSVQELANTGTSLIGLQLLLSNSFRAVLVPFIQRVEMFCSWDDWNSFCCFTHGVVDSDVCELAMHSTHVLYSTVNNCKLDMLQTELLKHL